MDQLTLSVPDMTCDHCVRSISSSLADVQGVTTYAVDLTSKTVRVHGDVDRRAVCEAIRDAGYEVAA